MNIIGEDDEPSSSSIFKSDEGSIASCREPSEEENERLQRLESAMEEEGPAVWQLQMAIEPKKVELGASDHDNIVN